MKKVVFFFVFGLLINAASAQIASQKIDELVTDAMTKFKVAGVSIAVVKDGKVIHSKGYGAADINTKSQ